MRLLSWNCQGFWNSWTIRGLHKIVRRQDPTVCFLMDTWMFREDFKKFCKDTNLPHWFIVKKPGFGGGLALLWEEGVDVRVINGSDNYILANIFEEDGSEWFLTSFNGWPKASQELNSRALLNHIKSFVYCPWLLGFVLEILMLFSVLSNTRLDQLMVNVNFVISYWRFPQSKWIVMSN